MKDALIPPTPYPDSFIDHYSHTGVGRIWPFPDRLFIVTCLSNPMRWHSRYHNYWRFAKAMEDSGVNLITVELAFGDRFFEVTEANNPHHIQLRTRDETWSKECQINLGVLRIPLGTKYVGYCDADLTFTRSDWAQEALHLLQHYDAVQLFSSYADLNSDQRCGRSLPSFAWNYISGQHIPPGEYGSKPVGAVGGAWAYRTEAFTAIGGMLDVCVLGSADWHMAMGLVGREDVHADIKTGAPNYVESIKRWQRRAWRNIKGNIGCVDNHAVHHWHGSKTQRFYASRPKILATHGYDPLEDIQRDYQGLYVLSGNKPKFRDAIRAYFASREEDDPTFADREKNA